MSGADKSSRAPSSTNRTVSSAAGFELSNLSATTVSQQPAPRDVPAVTPHEQLHNNLDEGQGLVDNGPTERQCTCKDVWACGFYLAGGCGKD